MPAKKLKGGPRGEGCNVDVMQCNWPCEVNVLTDDDSRHIPMHRYRTKSCFRGLRSLASLCERRIKLRRNIDEYIPRKSKDFSDFARAAVSINFSV